MQFIDLKAQQAPIRSEIERRIRAVLDHGQYVQGPEVEELEERLAAYVGVKHCVGVSSGTDALLIALMALNLRPGDEVITTPFTFIATGEVIRLLGAVPVFVDVDPQTYNIAPAAIEAAITPRTRAILPVSLYGQCADFDAINAIAERHDLPVIEDGAQSFGATYQGRRSCGLSTIGCTSFFPSKPLGGYGDGGACFTDDDALARAMREIRNHGQDRRYHHPVIGVNGRLDTLQAAILLAKFEIFPDEVVRRGDIGARYTELLEAAPLPLGARPGRPARITPPRLAPGNTSVYAQYTVQVPDRDAVQLAFQVAGIPTAVHYPVPLNQQPAFADVAQPHPTPVADALAERVISLPMHPWLSEEDQGRVVEALKAAVARGD